MAGSLGRVVLCDLTHTGQGYGSELVPYAIGCIDAYAKTNAILCKTVAELDEACRGRPDVVGFSHYMWNSDLSQQCAQRIKDRWPDCWIVFGGPNITLDDKQSIRWLEARPWLDSYVFGEGEIGFPLVVQERLWDSRDRIVQDLNDIPSPYLSGALDLFLENEHLVPIMECARGCPFTCTFCCDGANKAPVRHFSVERLQDELEYIAQSTKAKSLFLADANFGMYKQDEEFAEALAKCQERHGYPQYIIASTGKQHKERVIRVANKLGGALRVAASVQSMDKDVLREIGRTNVSTEDLTAIPKSLDRQTTTYSEMILGLPGDTGEKHLGGIRQLMHMGFDQIRMHQLTLLPGSELARRGGFTTRHRLLQRSFGEYEFLGEPLRSYETEEIVVAHETMTCGDYTYCRSFALTVALMYNECIATELSAFLEAIGVAYPEFLTWAHEQILDVHQPQSPVIEEYTHFWTKACLELYDTLDDLSESMARGGWQELLRGERGNNLLFNTQGHIRYHHDDDLNDLMFRLAGEHLRYCGVDLTEDQASGFAELEEYCRLLKGPLSDLDQEDTAVFHYNFGQPTPQRVPARELRFAYTPEQKEFIGGLLALYGTSDWGLGKLIARAPIKRTYRHVVETGAPNVD